MNAMPETPYYRKSIAQIHSPGLRNPIGESARCTMFATAILQSFHRKCLSRQHSCGQAAGSRQAVQMPDRLLKECIAVVHYNNKSPGGIKCCLFNQKEYSGIIAESPQAEKFFVEYEGRYGLKEPHNLDLSEDERVLYESIRRNKEHAQAFENTYDENSVVDFINIIASMLPASCRVHMDADEGHAQCCFQYEKIMFYSVLLEIAILSENEAQKKQMLELIASTAVRYGIIAEGAEREYACVEGVCLIIDEAKSKIALYQNP